MFLARLYQAKQLHQVLNPSRKVAYLDPLGSLALKALKIPKGLPSKWGLVLRFFKQSVTCHWDFSSLWKHYFGSRIILYPPKNLEDLLGFSHHFQTLPGGAGMCRDSVVNTLNSIEILYVEYVINSNTYHVKFTVCIYL